MAGHIEWALLAALGLRQRPDGLLDISGAGFDYCVVDELPATVHWGVAASVRLSEDVLDQALLVEAVGPSGDVLAQ
jgi:hypothetical protein